jgi:peroxiredoxin
VSIVRELRRVFRRLAPSISCCAAISAVAAGAGIQAGEQMPKFTLPAVRGGSFMLDEAARHPALIAFLQTIPDTADTPSRKEVALLKSMDHQYRSRGLRVAIIDATALATGSSGDRNSLINASYDWDLQLPLLEDKAGRVAKLLAVTKTPTTILVKADGQVAQVWECPMPPGELAVAIEKALGSGELVPAAPANQQALPK